MQLISFRALNFRSINDSGDISVTKLTSLLGRNESGKSNLLLALSSLNSVDGFEALDPIKDFPRHRRLTGQTGDHGIDGEGFLLINRFVRIKVMFQCKRYTGTVQVKEIRDFRGAIQGRSERGIFLTTGTFTKSAREEAARENATAIELVDIDRLLELLIEEGLGIRETKALTIDREFFTPYQKVRSS